MLVIISDLHLTDGTSDTSLSPEAFFLFAERLRELACRASWRADGTFRPLERIEVLLLGDILDFLHTQRWVDGAIRPWHDVSHPDLQQTFATVAAGILAHNAEGLACLRALVTQGVICPSPAVASGAGRMSSEAYRVSVRLHYMVGNHDWPLHLPGSAYDLIRQQVAQHLGLANPPHLPFPHDPYESDQILEVLRQHRTLARHGDLYDPLHFSEDRDLSSLGDALNIEVVGRFLYRVHRELDGDLPPQVLAHLHEIDNVRPLPMVPIFIDGLLERGCPSPALRKRVKQVWDRQVEEFLELESVRRRDTWLPFDLVDGLAGVLRFNSRSALGWAGRINAWLHSLRGASNPSYATHALAEQDFRNRRARNIVYGHTHGAESVPLDASYADGYVLNQMYFNTGTWRRVHRPTIFAPHEQEFIISESMNIVTLFTGDERAGRPFETWTGMLGIGAQAEPLFRIDAGKAGSSTPHAAAGAGVKAPHFAPSTPGMIARPHATPRG